MIVKKVTIMIGVVINDDEDNENYCWEIKFLFKKKMVTILMILFYSNNLFTKKQTR